MGCRHENCPVCEVDLYVKKRVMVDALKLAFKSRSHTNIEEIDYEFNSLERLYPLEDSDFSSVHDSFKAMVELFLGLAGKNLHFLTSAQFES